MTQTVCSVSVWSTGATGSLLPVSARAGKPPVAPKLTHYRTVCTIAVASLTWVGAFVGAAWADVSDGAEEAAAFARVRAYEQARINVIRRVVPAVTCVFNRGNRAGGGSGVIIDEAGYGLTNFHVVAGMLDEREGDVGLADGTIYEMEVLGIDPGGDVAMFRAYGRDGFPSVKLGDSDALSLGDFALAMGNPFLLAEDYTPTVTLGIISGLHRYQSGAGEGGRALRYTDCIQVDTSINPGNSGGPLFDLSGALIGINGRVSIEERGRVNVGVGYAISINQIKRFMPMLRAGLPTKHATAGFTVFDRGRSVVVDQILDDSPAYQAGLRLGDRILQFGDKPIESANQFGSLLGTYPALWPVGVVYQRGDQTFNVRFRLEDLPFPKAAKGRGGMFGTADPYGPHPVTKKANRRAVGRALHLYHRVLGGPQAVASVKEIRAVGSRTTSARPMDAPNEVQLREAREAAPALSECRTPVDIEQAIRWALFQTPGDLAKRGYRVVGADEVRGRIVVVIEHKAKDDPRFRIAFDDQDGRLLRIEFEDPISGKQVRYEYDDYRHVGSLKLPHSRWLYLDDRPYAVDRFKKLTVKG